MSATVLPPPARVADRGADRPTAVGAVVDAVLDSTVWSLALWTLLYSLGLATQWSLWPSAWIWLVVTVVILAGEVRRALRAPTVPGPEPVPNGTSGTEGFLAGLSARVSATWIRLLLGAGLVLVAVAGLGGLIWTPGTFRLTLLALALGMIALTLWSFVTGRLAGLGETTPDMGVPDGGAPDVRRLRWVRPEELGVLGVMLGTAVLASLVHLADTDDPYYVNRSVWVAERGNASLRDTMFSPEDFPTPYGGGIPVASIEALFGAVAHLVGTFAGTIVYVVAPPVFAALAVLAMWRLATRWAPRRVFAAFLVAVVFLMLSGDSMLGNFWIVRIWQGKVIAVVMLMPLIWAYLTELAESTDRRAQWRSVGLLLAAGIAFYGLTPTAIVWAPFMLAAALAAAVVVRSKLLAIGGVAVFLGPLVSGLAVVVFSSDVGGENPSVLPARASFVRILGDMAPMVALSLVGLALAVVTARRGAASALAGAAALISVLVFAPGVLPLVNAATGSGPILWRMLYLAPIPLLVGLLVTLPAPELGAARRTLARWLPAVPVAAVVASLALGGVPIWSETGHKGEVTLRSGPSWKLDTEALRDVRILIDAGVTGEVLMPPRRMKVLTMYSVQAFPIVPREWFIQNVDEPAKSRKARKTLMRLAAAERPFPSAKKARKALRRLDVDLACVGKSDSVEELVTLLDKAGYGADLTRYGSLTCARPGG